MRRRRVPALLLATALVSTGAVAGLSTPAAAVDPLPEPQVVSFGAGGLEPLQPARLLDTRSDGETVDGLARAEGAVAGGTSRTLQVAGRGGVPVVGAGAVWLNVTVTRPSAPGHLTVHPSGTGRPNASNLNYATGTTAPNLVLAKLGTGGRIEVAPSAATHVLADVVGWVPEGRDVQALQPARVLDTRGSGLTVDGQQQRTGAFTAGETRTLPLAGRAGVPAAGVGAVVLNLTAVGPTRPGHLTAWPAGTTIPNASSVNFAAGSITPNLVVAKVGTTGAISIRNVGGSTSVLADVVGWIPADASYGALSPTRILDTRGNGVTVDGQDQRTGALAGGVTRRLLVAGRGGVPETGAGAVVVNLTGTQPTRGTHLTVFPSGTPVPNASSLNLAAGATRANLVVAKLGADGALSIVGAAGATHVIADVVGWFPSGAATSTSAAESTTMTLQSGTVLGGPGDVRSASGDSTSGATVVLAPGADVPAVDGHLYLPPHQQAPAGLSGLVTAVTPASDGSTSVTLAPANLQDLFVDLVVSASFDDVGDLTPGTPSGARKAARGFPVPESCTPDGGGGVSLSGLSFSGVSGSFQLRLRDAYSRLLLRMTPTASLNVFASGGVSCTIPLPSIPIPAGPVLIELGPEVSISLSGALSTTVTMAAPVSLGYTFDKGDTTNLSGVALDASATGPEGSSELAFGIGAVLSAKIGGVVGIAADLTPQLGLAFTTAGCGELKGSVSVGLSAVAERWGVGWSFELARISLAEKVLQRFGDCGVPVWAGTIRTDYSYDYRTEDGLRSQPHTGSVDYSELVADSDGQTYHATVAGSGTVAYNNSDGCPTSGTWSLAGPTEGSDWASAGALRLETSEDGVRFGPYFLFAVHQFTNPCGPPSEAGTTVAGFESGRSYVTVDPLPDSDSDPRKLVGSVTYTLANPPAVLVNNPTDYSFTVTYDLTRVDLP